MNSELQRTRQFTASNSLYAHKQAITPPNNIEENHKNTIYKKLIVNKIKPKDECYLQA